MRADEGTQAHRTPGTQPRQRRVRRPIDCGADAARSASPQEHEEVAPTTVIPARGCCTEDTRTSGRSERAY